jgi:hypothetical protein
MMDYQADVDRLFRNIKSRCDSIEINPVTGNQFVPARDLRPQKRIANKALLARAWFEAQRPPDAPELPLGCRNCAALKREAIINADHIGYLVAWFGTSVMCHDYHTEGHPLFDEFARGVLASGLIPDEIGKDPDLLRRYPPERLPGLTGALVWVPLE